MKTLKQYMECGGCEHEVWECFIAQEQGFDAGLDFDEDEEHLGFFVINPKTNKFMVAIYSPYD